MIDTSKIKAGDKVRIDGSPNWRGVIKVFKTTRWISLEGGHLISESLITDHRPAEPVVPKGEGCVDWDKNVYYLDIDGYVEKMILETKEQIWRYSVAQGYVSNNRQHLERKRDRQRIEQELLECDGAVYEPFLFKNKNGIKAYVGVDRHGRIDFSFLAEVSYSNSVCNFINIETAESAIEKVGAERIRKAWGLDDDK